MANSSAIPLSKGTYSKKFTRLAAKTKYYAQVRVVKKVGGTLYYSAWSKKESCKTR